MFAPDPAALAGTPRWRIGEAARRSGVSAANMRYYEKEGLLRPGSRSENSYRLYSEADVHRLRFIRLCRAMDMSLDEVRTLLALDRNAPAGVLGAPGVAGAAGAAAAPCGWWCRAGWDVAEVSLCMDVLAGEAVGGACFRCAAIKILEVT